MSRESSAIHSDNETTDPTRDWGKLPYVALALIFSYLPDRDKFSASLVNRAWSEGFSWPGNWRQREMIFYGVCDDAVKKEKAFCERFGAQLRYLRLRCWCPGQGPALESYLANVAGAMHVLSQNTSLREIHVADVESLGYTDDELITVNDFLFESERKAEGKAKMAAIIGQLIRKQNSLRVLDVQVVDCTWEVRLELISAIAESSAATTTLHMLLLSGASNRLPSSEAASSPKYILAMSRFRKLAHLGIDYRCLSSKLLDVLGISLGSCFKMLAIFCAEEDGPDLPNLEEDAWSTLSSRCPFLRVKLTVVIPELGNRDSRWGEVLLKPGMPLVSLSLTGEMSIQNSEYWDTTAIIDLLVREYRNTLEHLYLTQSQSVVGLMAERLTTEMVSRALRLKRLKTLHLSGPLDPAEITTLYGLLDKSESAKHLEKLTLTAWCTSEEQIDLLLKLNRAASQNRDSGKPEVRLIPIL